MVAEGEMMEASSLALPILILILILIFIATLFLLRVLTDSITTTTAAKNHCPCTHPVIGNLPAFLANRHRFLEWAADMLAASPTGTIEVRGPLGLSRGVCTTDPASVDHLLRLRFSSYPKGHRFASHLSDLLGRGIFNTDSHLWALQRKLASREFTTRSLKTFITEIIYAETYRRLLPRLSAVAQSGEVLDMQDVLRRFAFDNICAVAFGTDAASLEYSNHDILFSKAFDEAVEISVARFFAPVPWVWKAKRLFNVGSEKRLRDAIKVIDDYAMNIITSREVQGFEKQDLLSRFMAAVNEDDGELGLIFRDAAEKRSFLRDIIISFVLAGKDSTSSALTWFFWLLSVNPRCEKRILAELPECHDNEFIGYEDLKGLHYLHAALSEALRLYPPVPINSRLAAADDTLPDGTQVRRGWFADYSAYGMARMEAVWGDDCREFVPERWLDDKGEFVPVEPVKFPVFHAGPRTCLGREMAYVQMKSVVASVLRMFHVEPVSASKSTELPPPYELSFTLRMKGGFPVRIKRRVG